MAFLMTALTPEEIKKIGVSNVRNSYNKLAETYNKIVEGDLVYCSICGNFITRNNFYTDKRYAAGLFPECKSCVLEQVEQRKKKGDPPNEDKSSVQYVLQKMNLPYLDEVYENQCKIIADEVNEKNRTSPFLQYITMIKSLRQYNGLTWANSQFGTEATTPIEFSNRKPRKEIMKIFGSQYSTDELLYLQDQYDEWRSRTQVDSKSQETYIIQICCQLLDIRNARRDGKDTTKLTDGLSKLMGDAKLQPKQNVENAATDSLTFGQLIEKWELEKPISEPLDEFKDPDHIGKYIRVWFKGALARALGLDNGFAQEYDEYVAQYTVDKPHQISNEDEVDESTYSKIFGRSE